MKHHEEEKADIVARTMLKKELREQLMASFKEKGITTMHDKRRVMNKVLGHKGILKGIDVERYQQLIAYVESKTTEELNPRYIGWLYVTESGKGITKVKMQKIMPQIPPKMGVVLVTAEAEEGEAAPFDVFGYVSYQFYSKHKGAVEESLKAFQMRADVSHTSKIHTLNDQLIIEEIPAYSIPLLDQESEKHHI